MNNITMHPKFLSFAFLACLTLSVVNQHASAKMLGDVESWKQDANTPIDRTPLFVKAGGIIPMGPEMLSVNEKQLSSLTLDMYPYGCAESRYELYEDDGISTKYLKGDYCTTAIEMHDTGASVSVTVHAREGKFTSPNRTCEVLVHGIEKKPAMVSLNGKPLESTHDKRTGILRVSFPDTGREQKLAVQR